MNISVFGLGYVGVVCSVCLAERGHQVIGVETHPLKAHLINSGRSPIVERDVDELVKRNVATGRLTATLDAQYAVASTDVSIICVGTPSQPDGSPELTAIKTVTRELGNAINAKGKEHCVVVRSTVLPGTTRDLIAPLLAGACNNIPFGVAFNPEFLREGSAVSDFNQPAKTVVGAINRETSDMVMSLYRDIPGPKFATDIETAEMIKYVDNAWHALKVAFGNEIGLFAKTLGVAPHDLMDIFVEDKTLNISDAYLRPGFAFGGACLPKDLRALIHLSGKLDLRLPVLGNVLESNRMLIDRGITWIFDHSKKRIAFLGISFKSGTDDVRESPFVEIIVRLLAKGRAIKIFDPNVQLTRLVGGNKEYLLRALPGVTELIVPNIIDAVTWADTIVVTAADPFYAEAIAGARSDQVVLDLSNRGGRKLEPTMEGFLW